jgi:hypothetical protein
MTVSKDRALELMDEKIKQFQYLHDKATYYTLYAPYDTLYNTDFHKTFDGTEKLLKELSLKDEAKNFVWVLG